MVTQTDSKPGVQPTAGEAPAEVYRRRSAERGVKASEFRALERRLALARLAIGAAALVTVGVVLFGGGISGWWLLFPVVLFVAALLWHERVMAERIRAERGRQFYERGLARINDTWQGSGRDGAQFADAAHPYAADFDLFGPGSVFQLLCSARTLSGERTLAAWLSHSATPKTIRRRQAAVQELRDRLNLRESVAAEGDEIASIVDPDSLVAWSQSPAHLVAPWAPWVAGVLAVINVVAVAMMPLQGLVPILITGTISGLFSLIFRRRATEVFGAIGRPEQDLRLLSGLLSRIEAERFTSPLLQDLRSALDADGAPPSQRIGRLARLAEINDSRSNMIFSPIASLLLLGTQLAFAMERWRSAYGAAVPSWIRAVGDFEALSAFAARSYENPLEPFPQIVEEGCCLAGRGLAHPLLPASVAVPNDVAFEPPLQLLLISGSNMSGKSTLLRTVGINVVLALAGATVRAASLEVSPLTVGACMRVQDSLQEGLSHFYAEIRRLRQIVDLCSPSDDTGSSSQPPVFFLFDEILHGTNSHDRRLGARALIRGLLERGAIGLVTTHDLALAQIADEAGDQAQNVHFTDHLENGKMVFDYRLQPGVVRKSNALELMRSVGLDV